MGRAANVGYDQFPSQGWLFNRRVEVCFHYDPTKTLHGVVVRDDAEAPGLLIIRLDDGRHILSTECSFREEPDSNG